jgi:hypothetical protein
MAHEDVNRVPLAQANAISQAVTQSFNHPTDALPVRVIADVARTQIASLIRSVVSTILGKSSETSEKEPCGPVSAL